MAGPPNTMASSAAAAQAAKVVVHHTNEKVVFILETNLCFTKDLHSHAKRGTADLSKSLSTTGRILYKEIFNENGIETIKPFVA
ncbi:hypothetical protein QJS10_CPB22g00505 [Acorus calamus]|uniref:Uncharacterized protein n=1 Tax=Acorus calamus TaxID=4465 RepID=A0AAV9C0C1_ACOCL|nr:hypothetical protein QJS10_CPB22g00505 [Acorus calamus]